MLSPVFDDDLRLLERVEDFAVEQFVTELRVEALAIAVFPWASRHDVGGFGTDCCDPLPECFGDAGQQGIAERSKNGPYEKIANGVVKSMQASYGQNRGTSPDVIADTVSKAIASSRPKTRYAVGAYAKPMIWIRKWLGDRIFDRMIKSQM